MKKRLALAAAMLLGGAVAAPAMAQTEPTQTGHTPGDQAPAEKKSKAKDGEGGFYAGAGINLYFVDKDYAATGLPIKFKDQPSPGAFVGRAGYAFNKYLAVEGEIGIGGAKSDFGANDVTLGNIGVENPMAAHVVGRIPLNNSTAYLLGRAGYTSFKVTREYNGRAPSDLELKGASFGIGAGARAGSWDYQFEYTFMSADGANSGVLGMFVMKRF